MNRGCAQACSKEAAVFYDHRYANGYMDEWPADKKNRIFGIVKKLNLPERGDALDYGCGNGVFTAVLRLALPEWNIYGVDISSIAVDNAKKRCPDCAFFLSNDPLLVNKKFDFLFSHHVLEHVSDIGQAWLEIARYLKKQSSVLHVLPCGNRDSFEYKLNLLRAEGAGRGEQDRFVFEDDSHLRRLTSHQMNNFAIGHGLSLSFDLYGNQFYGAVDWITLSSPLFILNMFNPKKAKDSLSALKLICLCAILGVIKVMRFPSNTIDYNRESLGKHKYYVLFFLLLIFYPLSKLTNIYLKRGCRLEWEKESNKKNGSEMYLYYKRELGAKNAGF